MKPKTIHRHLVFSEIAASMSKFSVANRRQVGAVVVSTDGRIAGTGYNGTPKGVDNSCEDADNVTQKYVIHAEVNAILNSHLADLQGSTIYVTLSPCVSCAAMILQKGISTVVYNEEYRDTAGIDFLKRHGVNVHSVIELLVSKLE